MSDSEQSPEVAEQSAGSPEVAAIAQTVAELVKRNTGSDGWKVAVMVGDGTVVCHAVLSTYTQVLLLAEGLKPAGFFMTMLESTLAEPDWHFVFRNEAGDDPLHQLSDR